MALRDTWHKALLYFGLAEDDRYVDEDSGEYVEPEAELEERYRTREQVRRVGARKRDEIDDIFADDSSSLSSKSSVCIQVCFGMGLGVKLRFRLRLRFRF
jgi:cell division inhibitor SepF